VGYISRKVFESYHKQFRQRGIIVEGFVAIKILRGYSLAPIF